MKLDVHGSIDHPFDKPRIAVARCHSVGSPAHAIAEDAIRGAVAQRDVPLVAVPPTFAQAPVGKPLVLPPSAGRPPRPRPPLHRTATEPAAIRGHTHRPPVLDAHA